jgi:hypothetical protein
MISITEVWDDISVKNNQMDDHSGDLSLLNILRVIHFD